MVNALLISVTLLSALHGTCLSLKLDNNFYDLFSLSHIYERVKFGNTAYLRAAYLDNHINENTARLLYSLARAFTQTGINSLSDYDSAPYLTSTLDTSVCLDVSRYQNHVQIDVACHFREFVTCVEGVLQQPDICLSERAASRAPCPQAAKCRAAYDTVAATESRTWLQLWAQETMNDLLQYRNNTADQIAAMMLKSCLHDSQFLSAIYNLALCSELARQVSFSTPRVIHPLAEVYCPDPCLRNPCRAADLRHQLVSTECSIGDIRWDSRHAIGHSWDDLQLQQQHKVEHQYTCRCRYGSWSPAERRCIRPTGGDYRTCSPSPANRHFPCEADGTTSCHDNNGSEEVPFTCRCKEGFVGVFCQERVDTCKNTFVEVQQQNSTLRMTGNEFCNVNHGGQPIDNSKTPVNICQPDLESREGYNCSCVKPFFRLITLQADNCIGVQRACDSELCVNGECISTPDLMTAGRCRCHSGWAGSDCTQQLNDWSLWSACRPVCGQNRTRRRERLGDIQLPSRLYQELEICAIRSCTDDTSEVDFAAFQTLMHASSADAAVLTGVVLLSVLSFAGLRFWRPRFSARKFQADN